MQLSTFKSFDISLSQADKKLYPYGTQKVKKELPVIGKVNLNVISLLTNKSSDVDFHVLDGESKNLLSVNTSVDLGLVKFTDSCAIITCETISN